ncbi:OB-fold-containig protein [Thalassotalea maritima]|uniref:OB-fold-containig protein n=1 Tax=Thalassotalea maritima TaxID=3242416 RepID=UPI0035280FAA
MLDFILSDLNFVYNVALAIVVGLSLLEGLALLIGASIMSLLDDMVDLNLDVDADVTTGGLTSVLGWLCLHKLPLLVWLVIMLTSFALCGLTYNYIIASSLNIDVLYWLSKPFALLGAGFCCHYFGEAIAKIVPKNESSAVSVDGFVGKVATITIGKASKGNAAQAVLQDEFNQKHYVMVEPEQTQHTFPQGTTVVLLHKQANIWLASELKQ